MINAVRAAVLAVTAAATAVGGFATLPAHAATDYTGTVVSRVPLSVRYAPTTQSARVGGLAPGAKVHPVCKVNGPTIDGNPRWYRLNSSHEWVAARYVANDGAAPGWCSSRTTPPATSPATWCVTGDLAASVVAERGGGSAGHQTLLVRLRNTSSHPCRTEGYPGVSLVGHGNGTQLGAAADRTPASTPAIVLRPGATAQAEMLIADAGNYPASTCRETTADGFRIYPPDERLALYAPYRVGACSNTSVHQLQVKPLRLVS